MHAVKHVVLPQALQQTKIGHSAILNKTSTVKKTAYINRAIKTKPRAFF